ncbi:beta-lactamase (plasmid) [Gemmatirosa kalamazoonensis]|uniref:Beta-lactamase n=1 Tax=Gemmatirosa kalamazoonensis TaxID=861299 RepID=W0RSG3_9BACT|nr:serine hydrolase [Gemmatirosa kalamazoonensis]AHG93230.1 beta-lactamase [Gemmatirosa kalamazoonensis]
MRENVRRTERKSFTPMAALGVLLQVSASAPLPAQRTPAPLAGFDAYVEHAVRDWGIAGVSVAVVKDDSVVYARGFGVRMAGKPDRVDENTVFAIGSNTKLFTAVAAGMLVDDGRMRWDDPATKFLPGFQLYDPWVTREITVRDLLSHRSGLGRRGDMIAYGAPRSRAEVLRRVRYLTPNSSFRSEFGYQNLMVLAAGEAAAAAADISWDRLVQDRILRPLGMRSSYTSLGELAGVANVATPHFSDGVHLTPRPYRDIDNIAPAGSITSSAADMARWLRFLLANGRANRRPGTRRLLDSATLREIESPQTITPGPDDPLSPSTHFRAYGLGVAMYDYLGVKVLWHTGGIDGMLSEIAFVPEKRLGIVVLTNTDGHNALFSAIARRALDGYLGTPPRDWSAMLLARMKQDESALEAAKRDAEQRRPEHTTATLPLDAYAGRYTSPMYGDVIVASQDGRLVAHLWGAFVVDLEHWAGDTYRARWRDRPDTLGITLVTFDVDPVGRVPSLHIRDDVALPAELRFFDDDAFTRVDDRARLTGPGRH